MKKLLLILALATALPLVQTGCSTPVNERVTQVQTLKGVGQARDAAMQVAGQLWRDGKITDAKRDEIIEFHDNVFQQAYLIAVDGVLHPDLHLASPELITLLTRLQTLIHSTQ